MSLELQYTSNYTNKKILQLPELRRLINCTLLQQNRLPSRSLSNKLDNMRYKIQYII